MRYCFALLLLLLVGTSAPAEEPIPLRAGPLTMVFDADNAMLRYLRVGRIEVLRGINAPVRNQFWGTVIPKVTNVKVADGGDKFTVSFDASCRERDIDFAWKGRIVGDTSGQVVFTFDGEARSTFMQCSPSRGHTGRVPGKGAHQGPGVEPGLDATCLGRWVPLRPRLGEHCLHRPVAVALGDP